MPPKVQVYVEFEDPETFTDLERLGARWGKDCDPTWVAQGLAAATPSLASYLSEWVPFDGEDELADGAAPSLQPRGQVVGVVADKRSLADDS